MESFYRVCFEPETFDRNFKDADQFKEWCSANLVGIDYEHFGFIIPDWKNVSRMCGIKLWMVGVPIPNPVSMDTPDPLVWFAKHSWMVDGYDLVVFVKPALGENEYLFPIRAGGNNHA